MTGTPLHYATLWEAIADRVADRPALRHGARVVTWGEFEERSARLAGALRSCGVGIQDSVGLYLYNYPEFFEVFFAALKIRARPFNANHRYRGEELLTLLDNSQARVVFYDAALRDRVASVAARAPGLRLLVEVGSGGVGPEIEGAVRYEELLASGTAAPRIDRPETDCYLNYTGGTTGLPKGVMSGVGRSVATALWFRDRFLDVPPSADPVGFAVRHASGDAPLTTIPASPLIHGVGFIYTSLPTLLSGGTVATLESRAFDAHELLRTVQAVRARLVGLVGDAFALPVVRALTDGPPGGGVYDTSSLRTIASAGVGWSVRLKARLLELIPQTELFDACGSTEGVAYGVRRTRRGAPLSSSNFDPVPGLKVCSPDGRELPPGAVGLLAGPTHGTGYHRSADSSASAFVTIDGVLCAVPGDLGRLEPDGSVTLIGRGTGTINTGGEKVYPAEVEEAVHALDDVDDCVVLGVPDERFGQAVAALVVLRPGHVPDPDGLTRSLRASLAGYKVPSRLAFVDQVPRAANGKVDYPAATALVRGAGAGRPEHGNAPATGA